MRTDRSTALRRTALVLLAVALCLALPFGVFAAWDARLFGRTQALDPEPGALSEAGRANDTACTLYAAGHLLGVGSGTPDFSEGWTPTTDPAVLTAALDDAGALLTRMADAGLPVDPTRWDELLRSIATPESAAASTVTVYTAPGGLRALRVWDERQSLTLAWTPAGVPFYAALIDNNAPLANPVTPGTLAAYLTLAGLTSFEDWTPVDWSGRLPDAGETAYSPTAQLYATANTRTGLQLSLTTLSPDQAEELVG